MWASRMRGKFFERCLNFGILLRVFGPAADERERQGFHQCADAAFAVAHAETVSDDLLQIHPAPAHDAVNFGVKASLYDLGQLPHLIGVQATRARRLPIPQAVGTLRVETMHPVPKRLPTHPANGAAASPRL